MRPKSTVWLRMELPLPVFSENKSSFASKCSVQVRRYLQSVSSQTYINWLVSWKEVEAQKISNCNFRYCNFRYHLFWNILNTRPLVELHFGTSSGCLKSRQNKHDWHYWHSSVTQQPLRCRIATHSPRPKRLLQISQFFIVSRSSKLTKSKGE